MTDIESPLSGHAGQVSSEFVLRALTRINEVPKDPAERDRLVRYLCARDLSRIPAGQSVDEAIKGILEETRGEPAPQGFHLEGSFHSGIR